MTIKTGEALEINLEDAEKAREALERLKEEGKDPRFYDDFSELDFSEEESGDNLDSELENVRKEIQGSEEQDETLENDDVPESFDDLKDKSSLGETQMSRRKFLKGLGIGTVTIGAGTASVAWFSKLFKHLNTKKYKQEDNREEENSQDKNISEESQEKEIQIENIADHYLRAYYELSKDPEKFPGDVFETDLLLAQQCQESRGQIDAKSHSGALGVMQNMTVSMQDVTRYLNILSRKEGFEWNGPKKLSRKKINQIKKLLIKKSDYSRAFGKIYLMQLWDKDSGYGAGRERYKEGDIKSTQIELMGAYNAGYSRVKNKTLEEWIKLRDKYKNIYTKTAQRKYRAYREAIDYVGKIMNYKERINNVREMIDEMNLELDGKENFLVREIALKLDEVSGISGEARRKKLETETRKYLLEVKEINEQEGRSPSYEEIKKFV